MGPLPDLPKFPFHTSVASAEKAKVLADPNKIFTLVYWEIASVGSTAREMLAAYCPKSKWTHEVVVRYNQTNCVLLSVTVVSILITCILLWHIEK